MAENERHASMMANNATLLVSGKYSDLTISCGDKEWHVHRAIVCRHQNFFAVACDGGFRESSTGKIDMNEDDPAILFRVLSYLYTGDYNDEKDGGDTITRSMTPTPHPIDTGSLHEENQITQQADDPHPTAAVPTGSQEESSINQSDLLEIRELELQQCLAVNVQVYAIADRLILPELKSLAKQRFEAQLKLLPISKFSPILDQILNSTPPSYPGLRASAITKCAESLEAIFDKESHWAPVLKQEPEFLLQLLWMSNRVSSNQLMAFAVEKRYRDELKLEDDVRIAKYQSLLDNKKLLDALERDSCRHCGDMFRPVAEVPFTGTIHCRNCRTRHHY